MASELEPGLVTLRQLDDIVESNIKYIIASVSKLLDQAKAKDDIGLLAKVGDSLEQLMIAEHERGRREGFKNGKSTK